MITPGQPDWIASFEAVYPRLFALIREAGWHPGQQSLGPTRWASRAGRFSYNCAALEIEMELGGLLLRSPLRGDNSAFKFEAGSTFEHLTCAADDYDEDVFQILGTNEAFPVGEGNGAVLFVTDTGRAALIDQSLSGFTRGSDPFALIEGILLNAEHPGVECVAVATGERVTGRGL